MTDQAKVMERITLVEIPKVFFMKSFVIAARLRKRYLNMITGLLISLSVLGEDEKVKEFLANRLTDAERKKIGLF